MKPRKDSADKGAGSGCMACLVRLLGLGDTCEWCKGRTIGNYIIDGQRVCEDCGEFVRCRVDGDWLEPPDHGDHKPSK
jgi:hypothetical protein